MKYRIFYTVTETWWQDVEAVNIERAEELFNEDSEDLSNPEFMDNSGVIVIDEVIEIGDET